MSGLSRKEFLGLSTAALAAAGSAAKAQPRPADRRPRPLLIRGADVLTMDPGLGELMRTDVLVRDGRIAAIGQGLAAPDAEVIDAAGMILTPGLIDNHRHVWESLECGAVVKTEPRKWAGYQLYKSQVMVCMTPEDFHLAEYAGGLMALDAGITTVVNYAHVHWTRDRAVAAARGFLESGVGGTFCYQLGHNPTHKIGDVLPRARATAERVSPPTEENFRTAEHLRGMFHSEGVVKFGLATSYGLGVRSMAETKVEFDRARALQPHLFASHIHLQPPLPEGIWRNVADLGRAGLLGPDFHVSHGVDMTDEELAMLRDTGGMVASTALGESHYLKPSIAPKARAQGVATGIGQDVSVALTADFFEVIRSQFTNMGRTAEFRKLAEAYDSTTVLDFATRTGAQGARYDDRGVIAVGKQADLVLLRTDRLGFAPFGSLADRVVNFAALQDVDSVFVRGVARKRGGRLLGVDTARLKARLFEAGSRIRRDAETIKLV